MLGKIGEDLMKVGDLVRSWGVLEKNHGFVVSLIGDERIMVRWYNGTVEAVDTFFLRLLGGDK